MKEKDNIEEDVLEIVYAKAHSFLSANGLFKGKGLPDMDVYRGEWCTVLIHKGHKPHFEVQFVLEGVNELCSLTLDDMSFPNLLGNLLWHNLIDKNFRKEP